MAHAQTLPTPRIRGDDEVLGQMLPEVLKYGGAGAFVYLLAVALIKEWIVVGPAHRREVADVPNWQSFNVYAIWNTAPASGLTGSTNTVVWELLLGSVLDAIGTQKSPASAAPALASQGAVNQGVSNTGLPYVGYATLLRSASLIAGRPLAIQVRRQAAASGDTLAASANLIGVVLERAS